MKFVAVLGLVVLFGAPLVESLSTLNDYIGSFTFYVDDNSQSQRNSFINNIGQRGMEHIAFYDKFRTRIIKRLQEIPGTNGLEIGKGFEKIVKKLKADLSYNITSNKYWDLADTCYFDIKDKLEVFTNTSDTSKQDSCWSTRRFTMYGILGKLGNDLTGILNTWLLDFHNPLTEFEAKMFADLVTLEGDFKKCNYKWKCIREYFKKITPDILAMQRSYSVEVLNIRNNAYSNLKPRFDLATAASFVVIDDLIACYNA